jgi:hypothetical protein
METIPLPKSGFLDRKYIKNHPAPSLRRGDNGKIVSSAVLLGSALDYIKFRSQAIFILSGADDKSGKLTDSEDQLAIHLGYTKHRRNTTRPDFEQFPNRPLLCYGMPSELDYGLPAEPQQVIDFCKTHATPQLLAQTFVISIHPKFNAILEKHGIDPNAITAEYAIRFLREWYEYCGWGGDVEIAQVVHFELDEAGDPHYHSHAITPGTGYDAATDQRIPVPAFVPVELLQAGHTIADRLALEEMDRVLTRSWRLEIPEMVNTFYDPVDLPIPEPSSDLDAWFPRPQIPSEALIPRPEPPSLVERLFPNGIWEMADGFGENDDINALVDGLFDDLVFENATDITIDLPIFEPNPVPPETDERDEDAHQIPPIASIASTKTDVLQNVSSDEPSDNDLIADNEPNEIRASKQTARRSTIPIYHPWVEPEPETPEQITQQIWSLIDQSEYSENDDESVNAATIADALFPASIWTVADSFGDETITQKTDELFGDWLQNALSSDHNIDLFPSTNATRLEHAAEKTESPSDAGNVSTTRAIGTATLTSHTTQLPQVETTLVKHWIEKSGIGLIAAHVEWIDAATGERKSSNEPIYLTSVMDHLFFSANGLNFDDAMADTQLALDEQLSQLNHVLESGQDAGMSAIYQSWFQTLALDTDALERGFLPDVPSDIVHIDKITEGRELDRLPNTRWIRDVATGIDYGLTVDVFTTDGDGHYFLQSMNRTIDENGLQQVEVIHINPHGQSLEDSAQTLWKNTNQFEHDFQTSADTEQLPLDVTDDQDEQLLAEMEGDDIEGDLSDLEWDDNPSDNYDDWPDL